MKHIVTYDALNIVTHDIFSKNEYLNVYVKNSGHVVLCVIKDTSVNFC